MRPLQSAGDTTLENRHVTLEAGFFMIYVTWAIRAGFRACTALLGKPKLRCIPLQAVPESGNCGRRPKKGQVAVDAWQPADVAKRNVRLYVHMLAQVDHGKLGTGYSRATAIVHRIVLCRCGIAMVDLCPHVERST